MLAEAEIAEQRNDQVFHTSYGWEVHHILNEIAQGKKNAKDIRDWMERDRKKFNKGFHPIALYAAPASSPLPTHSKA